MRAFARFLLRLAILSAVSLIVQLARFFVLPLSGGSDPQMLSLAELAAALGMLLVPAAVIALIGHAFFGIALMFALDVRDPGRGPWITALIATAAISWWFVGFLVSMSV